jgi:hypothetical protein
MPEAAITNHIQGHGSSGPCHGLREGEPAPVLVATVRVAVPVPPASETAAGEIEQVALELELKHPKRTVRANPLEGARLRVKFADCPPVTVAEAGAGVNEKSIGCGVAPESARKNPRPWAPKTSCPG